MDRFLFINLPIHLNVVRIRENDCKKNDNNDFLLFDAILKMGRRYDDVELVRQLQQLRCDKFYIFYRIN